MREEKKENVFFFFPVITRSVCAAPNAAAIEVGKQPLGPFFGCQDENRL